MFHYFINIWLKNLNLHVSLGSVINIFLSTKQSIGNNKKSEMTEKNTPPLVAHSNLHVHLLFFLLGLRLPFPWRLSLSSLVVNHAWLTELLLSLITTGWDAGMIVVSWDCRCPVARTATASDKLKLPLVGSWESAAIWPLLSMAVLLNVCEFTS